MKLICLAVILYALPLFAQDECDYKLYVDSLHGFSMEIPKQLKIDKGNAYYEYISREYGSPKYKFYVSSKRQFIDDFMGYDSEKLNVESDEYEDGKLTAQTRIMSSYGLLQQTFFAASDNKIAEFSVSNEKLAPEQLNEIEYSLKAYKEKMTKVLKDKTGLSWEKGFEAELNGIFASYNPGEEKYTKDVLIFSKKYLPSK